MVKKLLCSSSLLLCLCSAVFAQANNADFRFIDKIEGNWVMRTKQSTFREVWVRVNNDSWKGTSWRIVGTDSTKQDDMMLQRTADGMFYTIAAVSDVQTGQPLPFKLRVLKSIGFVAENLASSYPQKITYRFKDSRHMEARFEGKHEKTFSEIILQYVRE